MPGATSVMQRRRLPAKHPVRKRRVADDHRHDDHDLAVARDHSGRQVARRHTAKGVTEVVDDAAGGAHLAGHIHRHRHAHPAAVAALPPVASGCARAAVVEALE